MRWSIARRPWRAGRAIRRARRSSEDWSGTSIRRWRSSASSRAARSVRAEMRGVLVLACLLPTAAHAAPTMLNQIPTTDLVPVKQVSLQLQNGNTEVSGRSSVFHQPQLVPQSEFGLPGNIEAGLDVAPSDPPHDYRPVMNLKWNPVREDYRIPALAVGAMQLGVGFTPSYFLVLSKTLNYQQIQYQKFRAHHRNIKLRGIRLHAGLLRTSNAWRALAGTDIEVNDHLVIYSDWISGARNAVSLGGVLVIDRQNSVQASLLRGNDEDRVSGVLVGLDRKSTRLNSSHGYISYAVFCLKKKKKNA